MFDCVPPSAELRLSSSPRSGSQICILFILQVVNGDLNPVWKESFHFLVEDAVQDMVMAQVWDKDTFGKVINVSLHFQIQHFRTYDPPMEESQGN